MSNEQKKIISRIFITLFLAVVLVSCSKTTAKYSVGGTVKGLSGTLVLTNNTADDLTLKANGVFTFKTTLENNVDYAVTVKTQPSGQTCTVAYGTGTISKANVTNIAVTCAAAGHTYTVAGTLSGLGLSKTLVIRNNGGDDLSLTADGTFTFSTAIANGAAYGVDVYKRVADQNCLITNGSGIIAGANVTNVTIVCDEYHMFVTADMHDGNFGGVIGADAFCQAQRPLGANGTYKALITDGVSRIACVNENCSSNGIAEHVDWVLAASTEYYRLDDTIEIGITDTVGLFFIDPELLDNAPSDDGTYVWTGLHTDWTSAEDSCDSWNDATSDHTAEFGEADLNFNNLIDVGGSDYCNDDASDSLICVEQPVYTPYTYNIGVTVAGLGVGESLLLKNNGSDDLTVSANGNFIFATKLSDNALYQISISSGPAGKTCAIEDNYRRGLVSGDDVEINVYCRADRKMFVTALLYTGNLGGISGADLICMTDTNYPGSGNYKALLFSSDRVPGTDSWALQPYTAYYREDGVTRIGVTDATETFPFPPENGFSDDPGVFWFASSEFWTFNAGYSCIDWSSDSVLDMGLYRTNDGMGGGANSCDTPTSLVCVEQPEV